MMYVVLIMFYLFSIYFVALRKPTLEETVVAVILSFIPYLNYIFGFLWVVADVKCLAKAMIGAFDES